MAHLSGNGTAVSTNGVMDVLRVSTSELHARLEAQVDLSLALSSRDSYGKLLLRYFLIYRRLEKHMAEVPLTIQDALGWQERSKVELLRQDLCNLMLALPEDVTPTRGLCIPNLTDHNALFGALYVVEGSTLGGQIIYRRVQEELGIDRETGGRFFYGYGEKTGAMWKQFTVMLRQQVSDSGCAAEAAREMFHVFEVGLSARN